VWNEIKTFFGRRSSSSDEAKGRLHLVLARDRTGIDGARLLELRNEIAAVISKYIEIDPDSVDIEIERMSRDDSQLIVSSPLRR
jgi:cell division topological specificity factor